MRRLVTEFNTFRAVRAAQRARRGTFATHRRLWLVGVLAALIVGFTGANANAQTTPTDGETPPVDVLQVSGYLDHIEVSEIDRAIIRAAKDGAQALLLQINSQGATVPDAEIAGLADRIRASKVPVAMWVGPSGAKAYGAAGQLLGAAAVSSMAPGSTIGRFGPAIIPSSGPLTFGEATERLRNGTMGWQDARSSGALKLGNDLGGTAVLGEMIVALDGMKVGGTELHTARLNKAGTGREPSGNVRFAKLGLVNQLMHTFASKNVAYLLMAIGLGLLVFEFFTAGVGMAGVIGAACLIGGCYGLAALPTRAWAAGLLIASFVAFAVDVQTGVPRAWTGIAIVMFVVGSVFLFRDGRIGWISLLTGIAGILLTFLSGMPSMVRTRFATPTIGREWMIGSMGVAIADINPDGTAQIGNGQWRARTNRATPISAGESLRVVAIDGVTLEVEPEVGAAKDHREQRSSS